jgi:hypothetical protein
LLMGGVLGGAVLIGMIVFFFPAKPTIAYKGKPLEAWFYGGRTNFFLEETRQAAQEAIDSLGTNAYPFLLANLKQNRAATELFILNFIGRCQLGFKRE